MTSQYFFDNYAEPNNVKPIDARTHHVLLLDDNVRLSSMIARYILLSCREFGRSCALYHLGQAGQPKLTYYTSGQDGERRRASSSPNLEFAAFVAATPRHAIAWLEKARPRGLMIVADVRLQGDIDLGLLDMLDMLEDMQMPVYFIWVSNDAQNQLYVRPLIEQRKGAFVTKDSPEWSALPRRLVENATRITYSPVKEADYYLLGRLEAPAQAATPIAQPQIFG
jgi:hypothetical protein